MADVLGRPDLKVVSRSLGLEKTVTLHAWSDDSIEVIDLCIFSSSRRSTRGRPPSSYRLPVLVSRRWSLPAALKMTPLIRERTFLISIDSEPSREAIIIEVNSFFLSTNALKVVNDFLK